MQGRVTVISFSQWVRSKHYYLLALAGVILVQFLIFKWLYPYPNFLPDSYSYLETAMESRNINKWPIGYSWFLELFGLISRSHWWLVCCQYVLMEGAILYFVFSLGYMLQPSRWIFRCMVLTGVISPLVLHVSNFVSSDSLFAALSLIWFTQLLWITCNPRLTLLLLHAVILLMVFTVRYNSLYYPIISIVAILFTRMRNLWRWGGIILILLLPGTFVGYTQVHYFKEIGKAEFSPFSGWQLASNALYAYAHVRAEARSKDPTVYSILQQIVDRHMDSVQRSSHTPPVSEGIYYLWDPKSPLQEFLKVMWRGDSTTSEFKRWASVGTMYKAYGYYLVRTYPDAFLSYYVWPNLVSYYVPPSEFLGSYNMGADTVEQTAVYWFGLKTNVVRAKESDKVLHVNNFYPLALAIINMLFVLGSTAFALLGGFVSKARGVKKIYACIVLIWICNMVFSVLASPVVLRYQVFPMLVTQTIVLWIAENIFGKVMSTEHSDADNKQYL